MVVSVPADVEPLDVVRRRAADAAPRQRDVTRACLVAANPVGAAGGAMTVMFDRLIRGAC